MDWVLRRLCYAVGDTDRPVSWTSVYSLIRRTCPVGDGVCTHVNSRRKAFLYRDSNLQPDLNLDYKPSTLTNCAIGSPAWRLKTIYLYEKVKKSELKLEIKLVCYKSLPQQAHFYVKYHFVKI